MSRYINLQEEAKKRNERYQNTSEVVNSMVKDGLLTEEEASEAVSEVTRVAKKEGGEGSPAWQTGFNTWVNSLPTGQTAQEKQTRGANTGKQLTGLNRFSGAEEALQGVAGGDPATGVPDEEDFTNVTKDQIENSSTRYKVDNSGSYRAFVNKWVEKASQELSPDQLREFKNFAYRDMLQRIPQFAQADEKFNRAQDLKALESMVDKFLIQGDREGAYAVIEEFAPLALEPYEVEEYKNSVAFEISEKEVLTQAREHIENDNFSQAQEIIRSGTWTDADGNKRRMSDKQKEVIEQKAKGEYNTFVREQKEYTNNATNELYKLLATGSIVTPEGMLQAMEDYGGFNYLAKWDEDSAKRLLSMAESKIKEDPDAHSDHWLNELGRIASGKIGIGPEGESTVTRLGTEFEELADQLIDKGLVTFDEVRRIRDTATNIMDSDEYKRGLNNIKARFPDKEDALMREEVINLYNKEVLDYATTNNDGGDEAVRNWMEIFSSTGDVRDIYERLITTVIGDKYDDRVGKKTLTKNFGENLKVKGIFRGDMIGADADYRELVSKGTFLVDDALVDDYMGTSPENISEEFTEDGILGFTSILDSLAKDSGYTEEDLDRYDGLLRRRLEATALGIQDGLQQKLELNEMTQADRQYSIVGYNLLSDDTIGWWIKGRSDNKRVMARRIYDNEGNPLWEVYDGKSWIEFGLDPFEGANTVNAQNRKSAGDVQTIRVQAQNE